MRSRWVTFTVSLIRCLMTGSHLEQTSELSQALTSCRGHPVGSQCVPEGEELFRPAWVTWCSNYTVCLGGSSDFSCSDSCGLTSWEALFNSNLVFVVTDWILSRSTSAGRTRTCGTVENHIGRSTHCTWKWLNIIGSFALKVLPIKISQIGRCLRFQSLCCRMWMKIVCRAEELKPPQGGNMLRWPKLSWM